MIPSSITDASDLPSLFDEQPTVRISETLMKVMDRFNKELFLVIEGSAGFHDESVQRLHDIPVAERATFHKNLTSMSLLTDNFRKQK